MVSSTNAKSSPSTPGVIAHDQEVGALVVRSVKDTTSVTTVSVGYASKSATGASGATRMIL